MKINDKNAKQGNKREEDKTCFHTPPPPCENITKDAAFLLTIGSFLPTIELLCLPLCLGAFLLATGASFLTIGAFSLQLQLLYLQYESASNKHLNGL